MLSYTIGQGPWVGLDFETSVPREGERPQGVPVCVSLSDGVSAVVLHCRESGTKEAVERLLDGAVIVSFNLAFDLQCIIEAWPDLTPKIYKLLDEGRGLCAMIWQTLYLIATEKLPDDAAGYTSLATVAHDLLGVQLDKSADTWRMRYVELLHVPMAGWPPEAVEYARKDAETHLAVARAMLARDMQRFSKPVPALIHECRSAFAIRAQEVTGFPVNQNSVLDLSLRIEQQIVAINARCRDAGFVRANGSMDQKAVQAAVTADLTAQARDVSRYLTSKGVSVGKDVLELCRDPALQALTDRARLIKYQSTYLDQIRGRDVVYPRWRSLVSTGRTSCARPPVHQWPKDEGWRELFEAPPGYCFVVADFKAAELCHFSSICVDWFGFSDMGTAFANNIDVHTHFGAKVLNLPYETVAAGVEAGDQRMKNARGIAKPANFGWMTKMGTDRFMHSAKNYHVDHLIDPANVPAMRELWASTWSEVRPYWDKIARMARQNVTFEQPWSGRLRAGCSFTVMANQPFQGGTADAAKLCAYELRRAIECGSGVLRVATMPHSVHDEFILLAPVTYAHDVAVVLEQIMVWAAQTVAPNCTHGVDVVATKRWSKAAKRVVSEGRLQVWEG